MVRREMVKYRVGFVSNSSSSSYLCDFCGVIRGGWDACLEELEMYRCVYDHVFCYDHVDGILETQEIDDEDTVLSESCPLCRFEAMSTNDLIDYLLIESKKHIKTVLEEVKKRFKNYGEFYEYTRQNIPITKT
jgi:hypothetical protein